MWQRQWQQEIIPLLGVVEEVAMVMHGVVGWNWRVTKFWIRTLPRFGDMPGMLPGLFWLVVAMGG